MEYWGSELELVFYFLIEKRSNKLNMHFPDVKDFEQMEMKAAPQCPVPCVLV